MDHPTRQSPLLTPWYANWLNPFIPEEFLSECLWLPDRSRSMGIHLAAGRGSGKSRLMGRTIAWEDFLRGAPVVIFDPMGGTIDNFLSMIIRLPQPIQECLWPYVWYVDASGHSGHVIPMPLYYHLGNEGLYEVSQRFLDVVRKLDPHLQTASIEGWNSLWKLGTTAGTILAALGCQITEAEDLIQHPHDWIARARHVPPPVATEIAPAIHTLEAFALLKDDVRQRQSAAFLNKVALFMFDPTMRAMFGASDGGINWQTSVDEGHAILFDFRGEADVERRRFKMVWAFQSLMSYIKYRGMGRHRPISVIIDELTALFSPAVLATDLFAADLDELINVVARNCMVWLTIAHQELFQLSKPAQKTLLAMGTQILGVTNDRDAALVLARHFFPYDPHRVKKNTDYGTVEFTLQEQEYLNSNIFMGQGRFHFLARVAAGEGDTRGTLEPITIEGLDAGCYPDSELVAQAREQLMQRSGKRVSEVLREVEARRTLIKQPSPHPKNVQPARSFATLEKDGAFNNSIFREKKAATDAQAR